VQHFPRCAVAMYYLVEEARHLPMLLMSTEFGNTFVQEQISKRAQTTQIERAVDGKE
jgi:hypothetical protein